VPIDVAANVAENALKNFKLAPSTIKDFCVGIPDMAEKDMFQRMLLKQPLH
jgi:hypothetical protein